MPARNVTTEIWADPVFADLSPTAQLVWIRLITGPETTCAGTTRAPAKRLAADTNLDREVVEAAIEELVSVGLAERHGEVLWMPGWVSHQVSGRGMIIAARREASRRDLPPTLAIAITASLDARHGPPPEPTRKGSRQAAARLPPPSPQAAASLTAATEDYPVSVSGPSSLREEEGPTAAAPAPAPGAQAPPRDEAERCAAVGTAIAEGLEHVGDARIAAVLGTAVERMAALAAADPADLPDPGPPVEIDYGPPGTLDLEATVNAAGMRAWEEADLAKFDRTGDPRCLREIQRSGSPPSRAAVRARLLEAGDE